MATSNAGENDELVSIAENLGIGVFRGDENDLVFRTTEFLKAHPSKFICRVNGDCPFVDINLILEGYKEMMNGYDLVTNIKKRSYPYGILVEWFTSSLFNDLAYSAKECEKEHVTLHFYRMIEEINHFSMELDVNYSDIALTIDTEDDYNRIVDIFDRYSHIKPLLITYKNLLNDYTF